MNQPENIIFLGWKESSNSFLGNGIYAYNSRPHRDIYSNSDAPLISFLNTLTKGLRPAYGIILAGNVSWRDTRTRLQELAEEQEECPKKNGVSAIITFTGSEIIFREVPNALNPLSKEQFEEMFTSAKKVAIDSDAEACEARLSLLSKKLGRKRSHPIVSHLIHSGSGYNSYQRDALKLQEWVKDQLRPRFQ